MREDEIDEKKNKVKKLNLIEMNESIESKQHIYYEWKL